MGIFLKMGPHNSFIVNSLRRKKFIKSSFFVFLGSNIRAVDNQNIVPLPVREDPPISNQTVVRPKNPLLPAFRAHTTVPFPPLASNPNHSADHEPDHRGGRWQN